MYYYAEVDENDICIGIFESYDLIEDPMLIQVDGLDDTLFGLRYNRETGEWEAPSGFIPAHSTDNINYRATGKVLSDVLDGKVSSVNMVKPDENGNVNIPQQFTVKVLGNSSI
jgi:hypothetical protein